MELSKTRTNNLNVQRYSNLITVQELRRLYPQTESATETTCSGRESFVRILKGTDKRLVVICGPCSIHSEEVALDYANRFLRLVRRYEKKLYLMMRVYFEKPRTIVGWKGLINDPFIDGSNNMVVGLKLARKLLIEITGLGVPAATELLDPIIAAYLGELVSWVAIGARTTESQTHRQLASGLSAPVGYKNSTNGSLLPAVNAMKSAQTPHSFIGVNDTGQYGIVHTKGNPYGHVILRGSGSKPNFHIEDIMATEEFLESEGFPKRIMVDCSHDNSGGDHRKQFLVVKDLIAQKKMGNHSIFGLMLESNLNEGRQAIGKHQEAPLKYGVSITDSCLGFSDTEKLLDELYANLDV